MRRLPPRRKTIAEPPGPTPLSADDSTPAGHGGADRHDAFVALGANLGDARATLRHALDALARLPGTAVTAVSSFYRTAPVDSDGPDYLNAVARLRTACAPLELLDHLQALEDAAGRQRPYRNAPRTLDLDVLRYDDLRLNVPRLQLPHPRMYERAFVLVPLAEIAPGLVPPDCLAAVAGQAISPIPSD